MTIGISLLKASLCFNSTSLQIAQSVFWRTTHFERARAVEHNDTDKTVVNELKKTVNYTRVQGHLSAVDGESLTRFDK